MQYVYQPLNFRLDGGRLQIINRDCFTSPDEYDITTDTVDIGGELLLNVYARLKEDKPWAGKGFTVAREQFVMKPHNFPVTIGGEDSRPRMTADGIVCPTATGSVTIDTTTGALTTWTVGGRQMLLAPLEPYFWKPENDNQHAARFAERTAAWRDAARKRSVRSVRIEENRVIADMQLPVGADLTLTYTVKSDGRVKVDMDYKPTATGIQLMPKFGMRMRLPADYTRIRYHGRGPWENYPDRKRSAFIGIYEMPLADYETEYVRPQDNGNRCDIRWLEISSHNHRLRIDGCTPLCIRAWDYGEEDLGVRHPNEIRRGQFVNLNIDRNIHGVGGVDSWGQRTLPQYTIDGNKACHYAFILSWE